jgi:hypothetical protein
MAPHAEVNKMAPHAEVKNNNLNMGVLKTWITNVI